MARGVWISCIGIVLAVCSLCAADPASPQTAVKPTGGVTLEILDKQLAQLYQQQLQAGPLLRLMALIDLSRINGSLINETLFEALADGKGIEAQLAWEILHARLDTLSVDQRDKWLDEGIRLAMNGRFPRETVAPLIHAMTERPVTPETLAILDRVVKEGDLTTERSGNALLAARNAMTIWQDNDLLTALVNRNPQIRYQRNLAVIMDHLSGGALPIKNGVIQWREISHKRNQQIAASIRYQPPRKYWRYTGRSDVFEPPVKLVPDDMRRLIAAGPTQLLERVDLVVCVDATGSMTRPAPYISKNIEMLGRCLAPTLRGSRLGIMFYRHEVDPLFMKGCCELAAKSNGAQVGYQLTEDIDKQIANLANRANYAGGGHTGSAYFGAMQSALTKFNWLPDARRVIVCVGDSPMTPLTGAQIRELCGRMRYENVVMNFVIIHPSGLQAFAQEGMPDEDIVVYDLINDLGNFLGSNRNPVPDDFYNVPFPLIVARVIEANLPEGSKDKAKPIAKAIIPIIIAEASVRTGTK